MQKSLRSCGILGSSDMPLNMVRASKISLHLSSSMRHVTEFFVVSSEIFASSFGSFVLRTISADFHFRDQTPVFAVNASYSASRSVVLESAATRTVFLCPEEEGTVRGAPHGAVSLL